MILRSTRFRLISGYVLAAFLVAMAAAPGIPAYADGNDTLYVAPASGSYTVGQNFTVEIRENSNGEQINAVQADLSYTTANLQYVSIDATGTAFDVDAAKSGGNGKVSIARGNTSPLTGDRLVSKVTFKVIGGGSGSIQVLNSSVVLSHANNQNVVDTRSGSTYSLNAAPTPTPTPPGTPPASPPPATPPSSPGPSPAPIPTTRPIPVPSAGSKPNVTITPNPTPATPSANPVILPDDSQIDVEQPVTIETTPSNEKGVQKVEYYINGKLVMTVNEPPYSYSVATDKMRNGKYTLTTKTYYDDGKVDSSDAQITVNNPFGVTQLMLQLRHYAWLIVLLAFIIGGVVWAMFFRNRGGGDDFGDGYNGGYGADPNNPVSGGYAGYGPPPGGQVIGGPPGQTPPYVPGGPVSGDPNAQPPQYPPAGPGQGGSPQPPYGPY